MEVIVAMLPALISSPIGRLDDPPCSANSQRREQPCVPISRQQFPPAVWPGAVSGIRGFSGILPPSSSGLFCAFSWEERLLSYFSPAMDCQHFLHHASANGNLFRGEGVDHAPQCF